MKVKFSGRTNVPSVYFQDLKVNDSFRLKNGQAVYIKCVLKKPLSTYGNKYGMFEIATGNVFEPSNQWAEVVLVDVTVEVDSFRYTPNL